MRGLTCRKTRVDPPENHSLTRSGKTKHIFSCVHVWGINIIPLKNKDDAFYTISNINIYRAMGVPLLFEEALASRLDLFKPSLPLVQDFLEKRPPKGKHQLS